MNRTRMLALGSALALIGLWMVYPVYAHCGKCALSGKQVVKLMDDYKFTLNKAIDTAEKHSKGRAVSVVPGIEDGELAIEVYCMVGEKIMACDVDAKTGQVAQMKEQKHFPISAEGHEEAAEHEHKEKQSAATSFRNRQVEAGCASCIYHMPGVTGCQLAAKIDGKPYLVTGADVDAHEAGLCSAAKQAVVTGKIEGAKVVATSFELKQ